MSEWKKATIIVEFREPKPNAHEWKYVGRTPQGGLAGGDDVHECKLCGKSNFDESWNSHCWEASEKGKVENVEFGYKNGHQITKQAILGEDVIVKDSFGIHIIDKSIFQKLYKIIEEKET